MFSLTKSKLVSLCCSALFLSNITNATLLDQGSYFYDSETNLEWLDLSATQSLNTPEITASFNTSLKGWRFATNKEFERLAFGQDYVDNHPDSHFFPSPANFSLNGTLTSYFLNAPAPAGLLSTEYSEHAILGFVGRIVDGASDRFGSVYKYEYDAFAETRGFNMFQRLDGTFVVRQHAQVSEPSSLALLCLSFMFLVFRKKIQKISL